jgi:antitoxin (DNA-binding transcriptional repressor) of toxin-antitoxin stability system
MRALDRGEEFIVTNNGRPVGELRPIRPRQFVPVATLQAAFRGVGEIDAKQFFADIDSIADQDPTPRFWNDS